MNEPATTDKLYALQASPIFRGMEESEILLLAEVAQPRTFSAGAVICAAEIDPSRLFIRIAGDARGESGVPAGDVFPVTALLFDAPLEESIHAGESGCDCLTISKAHLYTLLAECPEVVVNIMEALPSIAVAGEGASE